MLKAKDIMTREIHTVTPDTSVEELARRFLATKVNAMPVVDENGRLLGIISESDLIAQDRPLHLPTVISLFDWVIYLESEDRFRKQVEELTAQKVGEIFTSDVATCGPETTVQEIASMMVEKGVHLIPVMENDKLLGVVARIDIIRSMGF
jgi:CBS domain-containing protein